jgi:Na+/H+ antiporter NhaC
MKSSRLLNKKHYLRALIMLLFVFVQIKGHASIFQIDQFQKYPDKIAIIITTTKDTDSSIISINDELQSVYFSKSGIGKAYIQDIEKQLFYIKMQDEYAGNLYFKSEKENKITFKHIPLWMSILPPLLSIILALITKQVIISLFTGILIGAWTFKGLSFSAVINGFLYTIDTLIVDALTDSGHASVIIFSMLIGGMVAIISKNGGMQGIVDKLSRFANSAKNTQFVTWLMGVLIFFDDYANTLIVGNTMRPVTDKFKISREKLAYIVDSTAAPIAAIALITTWIGAELGYIADAIDHISLNESPYLIFLKSLKYSIYPILTLLFILILIKTGKDFGPMYKAEKNARNKNEFNTHSNSEDHISKEQEEFSPHPDTPKYYLNGLIPILTLITGTVAGLFITGYSAEVWQNDNDFFNKLSITIGNADSYTALLWSSSIGVLIAIILSLITKTLNATQSMEALLTGFKTMLPTMIILLLAWSLAETTQILQTSDFLINLFIGVVSVKWIPLITFILSALISFSTGTSWGTMAILYPLLLPLTWSLGIESNMEEATLLPIFYNVVASVLGGSVLGDHCSPISDTTVLSSMASGCNHIEHVRTQMPYALSVGFISTLLGGILMVFMNLPFLLVIAIGVVSCYIVIHIWGKQVE